MHSAEGFYHVTACNATHGIAVTILFVRLFVRCVYCDKTAFLSEICAQSDPPPSKNADFDISAYDVSAVRDSEKKFNYDKYKVDHGLSNKP